jgi:hypothetical protein
MTWADGFVLLLGGGGACLAGVYIAACVVPRLGGAGEREGREQGGGPQETNAARRRRGARGVEHALPEREAGALAGGDGLAPGWGRALRRLDAVRLERERDLRGGFAAGHGQMIGAGECSRQSAGGGK